MITNWIDILAENEQKAFYAYAHNPNEETKAAHAKAKELLINYAKELGLIK